MTMERRILPPPPKTDRTASLTFSPVGQRVTSAIRPIGLLKTGAIKIPGGEFAIPDRPILTHPFTPEEIQAEADFAKLSPKEQEKLIQDTLDLLKHMEKGGEIGGDGASTPTSGTGNNQPSKN